MRSSGLTSRWLFLAGVLGGLLTASGCGSTGKYADGHRCKSDDQCSSGYCECASACNTGCCRPVPPAPPACVAACIDLVCEP